VYMDRLEEKLETGAVHRRGGWAQREHLTGGDYGKRRKCWGSMTTKEERIGAPMEANDERIGDSTTAKEEWIEAMTTTEGATKKSRRGRSHDSCSRWWQRAANATPLKLSHRQDGRSVRRERSVIVRVSLTRSTQVTTRAFLSLGMGLVRREANNQLSK
jgi:hypothetical protein